MVDLPLDLRGALELVALRRGAGPEGLVHDRVIGQTRLVDELRAIGRANDHDSCLIALGADPDELRTNIAATGPEQVLTLVAGPLRPVLRALRGARRGQVALPADLTASTWQSLGYERIATDGIQGLGSLAWATGERILHVFNRPDLADRCRIAMQRTLVAGRPVAFAAIHLRCYRRADR